MQQQNLVEQGLDHFRESRFSQAEAACRQALQANPRDVDAMVLLARIAARFGHPNAAVQLLEQAAGLKPDSPVVYCVLGSVLLSMEKLDQAQAAFERVIELSPHDFDAHHNLGVVHERLGRLPEAGASMQAAVNVAPNHALARLNLATILRDLGRLDESVKHFERAIAIDPNMGHAHMGLAWVLLLRGDFRHGWAEYEWRWRCPGASPPSFPRPIWEGSSPAGWTIMLHSEQGLGDSIHFSRYAAVLAGQGAKVILYCPRNLQSLLATAPGVWQCISERAALPAFDVWLPLLSAPSRLGTTLESIPAPGAYLSANATLASQWRERLAADGSPSMPRVGLCWAGNRANINDVNRSIPPELLAPLMAQPRMMFYNLQVGNEKKPPGLIDHTAAIRDFADTAAFIQNLDLVISADTAVAHLAGALGKPVWTLLPYAPDWRWLLDRSDSPWYPSMRLFRKMPCQAWPPLIEAVRVELAKWLSARGVPAELPYSVPGSAARS